MSLKNFLTASVVTCITLTLAACKKEAPVIQYGPRTETGTLVKADLSLVRRGTHKLVVPGSMTIFLESRTTNLSDYEGQIVSVDGTLEPNTAPETTPVLVVESIKGLDENVDLHRFEVPELNLRIGIPVGWEGSIENHIARFRMADETEPLLSIRRMSGSSLPPGGTMMFIKNRRTTRINADGGSADIFILDKDTVIVLHFDPSLQSKIQSKDDADIVAAQFERSLSSISFLGDKETPNVSTGSGSGMMCGGAAGILCPEGSFCDITDFDTRSGQCKKR